MALRLLTVDFPHLPAPCVHVTTVYPDRLELSFHEDFAAFEAWRAALSIAPGSVVHHVQGDGQTGVLNVRTTFAGADLELTGYGPAPAVKRALSGSGALS
ncbi:hypothetical protein ACWGN5_23905 [Streptomyces sp. NPDC055815]